MAFVRSPRGAKTRFSVARVAHGITQLYVGAMGSRTTHHRRQIQAHAQAVHLALRTQLGEAAGVEWSRANIRQAVESELRRNAPMEVHEYFLEEEARRTREKPLPEERWSRFEGMPEANPDQVDPAWGVAAAAMALSTDAPTGPGGLDALGVPARASKARARPAAAKPEAARRSDWIAWMRTLARHVTHAFDAEAFERQLLKLPPDLRAMDDHGWWGFWQQQIDDAMRDDPRAVGLLRVLQETRERARVLGDHWLSASGLPGLPPASTTLVSTREGTALYQALWKEHIHRLAKGPDGNGRFLERFDIDALAQRLEPQRDRLIDWRGLQWMATTESLWALPFEEWAAAPGRRPHPEARELPQWAWMRVAMGLSLDEERPTDQALRFYEVFSTLAAVPSETMLREAGKAAPRYLEDEAGVVHDEFESILHAMHRAALNTKWTGTIALDWREVRAQGAPIASRRTSQGPIGFLRSIHDSLAAQGRTGEDRPVTVSLPLWHRDVEGFLGLRQADGGRLQTVVTIPDLFFERLQTGDSWVLLDPAAYPEVLEEGDGYLRAEARWKAEGAKNGLTAKVVASDRLWGRLVKAMHQGSPFVTFEGSDRAFAPFPATAPPAGGIDGVGAMPVPGDRGTPFVSWPAMAVDLSKTLDSDGNPDPDRMKHVAAVAMRALDNAIDASRLPDGSATLHYRPVCLGAVGFFEAINRGSASSENDPELVTAWVSGLAEAWSAVVLLADQLLRRERGAAPAWAQSADARPFDPLGSIDRLKASRNGSLGHKPHPQQEWTATRFRQGHRCSVRTVWAPYQGAAKMAGVTPGGMGTLRPLDLVLDEDGDARWCPTPLIMELLRQRPEDSDVLREVLRHPRHPRRWPALVQALTFPSPEGWERRLLHAAHIRPWIDQGVSLTLPVGLAPETLGTLVRRAWWLGLSNVRFESIFPDAEQFANPGESMDNPGKDG